ncbi:hypothetical protein Fmac_003526 [Flemingia macrophylla]|uniref:Uncharacterized protein n=1 Tax=Flemingia macrophylla TaxID=520843 RepID=A0ABD1NN01_9FABA
MIKRSPSRNQRSRGIKVKHVLQITLLLGVCFWLIYQVKHSHDKKKEFDENDAKMSVRSRSKLGRKDLHLSKDEVNQNEKPEEEDEDENDVEDDDDKHEHSAHEEGNEHESVEKDDKDGVRGGGDEQEEDENKSDEMEDEKGGGDDEIDVNDQEQSAVDTDHDEESMDEDKGNEEESDEKEKENIKEGSLASNNSHEAREENYKGDDASSAVSHDAGTISAETEALSIENSAVNSEMNLTKSENSTNYSEETNKNQHSSNFNITGAELPGGLSSDAISGKETGSNSLSNSVDSSHLDNIATTYSEAGSNPTVVIPEVSNNWTGTSANTSSEPNKMLMFSESNQAQNGTVNTTVTVDVKNVQKEGLEQRGNTVSEENLPGSNFTVPAETEKGDAAAGESFNLEVGELEKTTRFVASNETGNSGNTETSDTNKTQNISYMKENTDATKDEFKGDTLTDETSDPGIGTSLSNEHHDDGSSDSHILKNVAEVRTDQDSWPDIRNAGNNGDATATD